MEKIFNKMSVFVGVVGGFTLQQLGGYDKFLQGLFILVVLDYLSGLAKAGYTSKLSSEIGFRGIIKKATIFIVIGGMVAITPLLPVNLPLRETTILFFAMNELLSILENASVMLPIPDAVKTRLLQIRDKTIESLKDVG